MAEVVALGELLVDFSLLHTGEGGYPVMAAHPGGAPANYLATLSRFGVKTALLAKVGDDAFGRLLMNTLRCEGVDVGGVVRDPNVFTTLAFVSLDQKGEREFSFARKPGADTCLCAQELNLELIREARVFHFGSLSLTHEPSRTASQQAVACAKEAGCLISYDPNLRMPLWSSPELAREQLCWGLSKADVVKLSREEMEFLFKRNAQDGARYLLDNYSLQLVFVTEGAKGCFFANRRACGQVSALQNVDARDTTGAGDIFFGSAMWKLLSFGKAPRELEEAELREAVSFACTAAGLSTEKAGGLSAIPSIEEVLKEMEGA